MQTIFLNIKLAEISCKIIWKLKWSVYPITKWKCVLRGLHYTINKMDQCDAVKIPVTGIYFLSK